MVVWMRWGNMVHYFFREDLGEVGIFQQEGDFGFHLLSGDSEFCCCGKFDNKQRVQEESFVIVSEDPVDLMIVQGVLEVLVLCVMV